MAFRTLSTELIEYGDRAVDYFRQQGFVVRAEVLEIGFPSMPALTCRRLPTSLVVHVVSEVPKAPLKDWINYAKASGRDLRIALLLPEAQWALVNASLRDELEHDGVGVYVAKANQIDEIREAQDIGVNVALPDLAQFPREIRQLLGMAYDHFRHRRWREGFDEACRVLESQARAYLRAGIPHRITVVSQAGKNITPDRAKIARMTLGQLARTFEQIQNQTLNDSQIGKTLSSINPDRVARAHGKRRAATERRLRQNVGQHMHAIVGALRHMQ